MDTTRLLLHRSTTDEESCCRPCVGQTMIRKGVESTKGTYPMLGIDVAKDSLVCTLVDPATHRTVWERSVSNTTTGVKSLLEATDSNITWVLEPTGRYSTSVVKQATAAKRSVLLAPPRQAKSFLKSVQSRAKTDRLDSRGLALFALSRPLLPFPIKSQTVEQIDQLLSARKGLAQAIISLGQQCQELPHAKEALTRALAELVAQQKALDRQIAALSREAPELAATTALSKVPGIGPVTAAALAARLSGGRFSHPDKLVAYIGLDIGVVQSGKRRGERGLTKQGDAELRRLLYLCAKSSLRARNSPFKEQYEREKVKGLSNKAALCAVARKMAKVCWSLVQHGSEFDPQRVYQQPSRKEKP